MVVRLNERRGQTRQGGFAGATRGIDERSSRGELSHLQRYIQGRHGSSSGHDEGERSTPEMKARSSRSRQLNPSCFPPTATQTQKF
jgi:hypothetical protein